jgi:cytochrome c553
MLKSCILAVAFLSATTAAAAATDAELERKFAQTVRPFLATYCTGCHAGAKPQANLDLGQYATVESVVRDYDHWTQVVEKLTAKAMPPKVAKQPSDSSRRDVIEWVNDLKKNEAAKNAGDPGRVLARRLSNAEYNYTIRDLTGVDLRPASQFPIDPANQSGFDNSGESLTMSPALMAKYLEAARMVANHMVLKPDAIAFAAHPMLVETDREKYAVQRIVDFYDRQPTDFAAYFEAAWRYRHRAALGRPRATLASVAAEMKLSAKYLPMVWQFLEQMKEDVGPGAKLQLMWRELPAPRKVEGPAPKANQIDIARDGTVRMRDFVVRIRRHTGRLITSPAAEGFGVNFQPIAAWRNRQISLTHRDYDPNALRVEGEPLPDLIVTRGPTFGNGEAARLKVEIAKYIKDRQEDPDLLVPAGERERYEAALARFSSVFPDRFHLRERGRFYPIDTMDEGRYLSAGLHNLMGYFRDDVALGELILDETRQQELDTLWEEFEFISDYTTKTFLQFVFNTGGRGALTRPEFDEATEERTIVTMRDEYLQRAGLTENPVIIQAIKDHFNGINRTIRWAERARVEAEPRHLEALLTFAARAYRRPLDDVDRADILAYYRELRDKSGLTHEEAMRASIVSLLVSPDFCYRIER